MVALSAPGGRMTLNNAGGSGIRAALSGTPVRGRGEEGGEYTGRGGEGRGEGEGEVAGGAEGRGS